MSGLVWLWLLLAAPAAVVIRAGLVHDRGRADRWDVVVMAVLWPGTLAAVVAMLGHECWVAWRATRRR